MSTKCCSFTKDSICLWQHQPEPALSWGNPLWYLFNPSKLHRHDHHVCQRSHVSPRKAAVVCVDCWCLFNSLWFTKLLLLGGGDTVAMMKMKRWTIVILIKGWWLTFNLRVVLLLDVAQDLVNAVYLVAEPGRLKVFSLLFLLWHDRMVESTPVYLQCRPKHDWSSPLSLSWALEAARPIRDKRYTAPNGETWPLTGTCHLTRNRRSGHTYDPPSTTYRSSELF